MALVFMSVARSWSSQGMQPGGNVIQHERRKTEAGAHKSRLKHKSILVTSNFGDTHIVQKSGPFINELTTDS